MSLANNLISYWKLDESSGNAADSVGSNTLTNNNTVAFAAGKINSGADFDSASSESFSIADASQTGLDITGDISIGVWVKFETLPASGGSMVLASKWGATAAQQSYYFAAYESSGTQYISFAFKDGTNITNIDSSWTPSTGTWYYIVATADVSVPDINIYVDGSDIGGTQGNSGATSIVNGTDAFRIGQSDSSGGYLNGFLDELGIWSKVLTTTEITELYNSGAGLQYPFSGKTAKVLVVGGGGGGDHGGGGGGGVEYNAAFTVSNGAYSVTVGAGGAASTAGSNSVFDTITANGGGDGGAINNNGNAGGSGGGAGGIYNSSLTGGSATETIGNAGGATSTDAGGTNRGSAGGGGGGAVGQATQSNGSVSGNGGDGYQSSITGTNTYYAGGGGGGGWVTPVTAGSGGQGGGGDGQIDTTVGDSGTANTGGGGGGGGATAGGGPGGSGVVIVAYTTSEFSHTGGDDTGTNGTETWVKFTSSGTLTLTPAFTPKAIMF